MKYSNLVINIPFYCIFSSFLHEFISQDANKYIKYITESSAGIGLTGKIESSLRRFLIYYSRIS